MESRKPGKGLLDSVYMKNTVMDIWQLFVNKYDYG